MFKSGSVPVVRALGLHVVAPGSNLVVISGLDLFPVVLCIQHSIPPRTQTFQLPFCQSPSKYFPIDLDLIF